MTDNYKDQAARLSELEYRLLVIERQHPEFFSKYSSLVRSQEELEHKVIEQEHRFLAIWYNFFRTFRGGQNGKRWPALKAVLQSLVPGRVAVIVTSGTLIGFFTLLLMFQNNKLLASQNYWLQRQINVQAESDRQVQLAQIIEKLYEPSAEPNQLLKSYSECALGIQDELTLLETCGRKPKLKAKFRDVSRTQALKAYLSIQYDPLKKAEIESISLLDSARSLWPEVIRLKSFITKAELGISKVSVSSETSSCDPPTVAELPQAILNGVHLPSTCLKNANLDSVNLDDAFLAGTNLDKANLLNSSLNGANLTTASLIGATLEMADMNNTNLIRANLTSSRMAAAILDGASLDGAILNNANMENASLNKARLWKAELKDVSIDYSSLIKADLRDSNLTYATLSHSNLSHASLIGANLYGAFLYRADLNNANLSGANLSGANLKWAKFWNADLQSTKLNGAKNFTCTQLKSARNWEESTHDLECE